MFEQIRSMMVWGYRSYVLVVVLALIVAGALAPVVWTVTEDHGTVVVVPVEGTLDGETASEYRSMMATVRSDPAIDAVVLVVNSGGGSSASSEEMYLQTKRTAEALPVVASVDASALSGAYFTITPADTVYVKPASTVGSIGVLVTLPTPVEPNDVIATTGPDKLTGADRREFQYLLDSIHQAFLEAVITQRDTELALSRAELSEGQVYSGAQAIEVGLADEIGGRTAAIEAAANRAGLSDYRVQIMRPESSEFVSRNNYLASDTPGKELIPARRLVSSGSAPVFLSIPQSYVAEGLLVENGVAQTIGDSESRQSQRNASRGVVD